MNLIPSNIFFLEIKETKFNASVFIAYSILGSLDDVIVKGSQQKPNEFIFFQLDNGDASKSIPDCIKNEITMGTLWVQPENGTGKYQEAFRGCLEIALLLIVPLSIVFRRYPGSSDSRRPFYDFMELVMHKWCFNAPVEVTKEFVRRCLPTL